MKNCMQPKMNCFNVSLFAVAVMWLSTSSAFGAARVETFTQISELDLTGEYQYAVNLGGQWTRDAITIQNATFIDHRESSDVRMTYDGVFVEMFAYETKPEYGDASLEALMHGMVMSHTGRPSSLQFSMDVTLKQAYELQLFFSENNYKQANARHFDILVDGQTVVDGAFTPIPVVADWSSADAPHTGVLVTYQFVASDNELNVELIQAGLGDSTPYMNAFTLQAIAELDDGVYVKIPEGSAGALLCGLSTLVWVILRRRQH